ncbi:FCD domain-containing protein [Fluviibacterium sp. DFM31]|uniref:FCD domain-containing protein n=1 Tax=Meridianimarinicoccus marinus TaxID=3231483 RepID=A0ABV3L7F0_9RHOB
MDRPNYSAETRPAPSEDPAPGPSGGRAADAIVRQIQGRILSGALPDKAALPPERKLMEEFSASRTVIREAVAALASQGLVEARPRHRPIVRRPGFDTALSSVGGIISMMMQQRSGVESLYFSRIFIERGLVRDAATSAGRDHIAALKSALADNKAAIEDSGAFYATDVAFHGVLYSVPGNPIFPALHTAYVDWLSPHWNKMMSQPERNKLNYAAHEAIYRAILERDPDAAEAALIRHLDSAWQDVRNTFELG